MTDVLVPPPSAPVEAPAVPIPVVVRVRANLLPDEVVATRRLARLKRRLAAALTLLVLVLVAGYAYSWWQTGNAESDLATEQSTTTSLTAQSQQYGPLLTAQAQTAQLQQQLAQAMQGDVQWSVLLAKLRGAAAGGLAVTSVSATVTPPGSVAAAGESAPNPLDTSGDQTVGDVTLSGTTPNYRAVADYVDALAKIKGVTVVDPGSVTHAPGSFTFSVTLSLTTDALGGRFTPKTTAPAPTPTTSTGGS